MSQFISPSIFDSMILRLQSFPGGSRTYQIGIQLGEFGGLYQFERRNGLALGF